MGRMTYVSARADGNLDFDALIELIRQRYADTVVTDADYYASRIARQTKNSKALGMQIPNAPLDCTIRISKEHGVQRQIQIPIREGLRLYGRLDRLGCLFGINTDATEAPTKGDIQPLVEILKDARLRIELGEFLDG
jgi:hypothetical protein